MLEAGEYKELEAKEKLLAQNLKALQAESDENQRQINEKIRQHEKISGANEQRMIQLEEMTQGYIANADIEKKLKKS